jgi:hypothetical protein
MPNNKNYSLDQVENFLYDAFSTDATPQEIYDVIKGVVEDNYKVYTESANKAQDLLALLNGHRPVDLEHSEYYYDYNRNKPNLVPCDRNNTSEECKKSWNDFWENQQYTDEELDAMCAAATSAKKDKVKKWVLPVEEVENGDTMETEYFITFPDDLLEAADLKEGDQIEWVDNHNGSFSLFKKVN